MNEEFEGHVLYSMVQPYIKNKDKARELCTKIRKEGFLHIERIEDLLRTLDRNIMQK